MRNTYFFAIVLTLVVVVGLISAGGYEQNTASQNMDAEKAAAPVKIAGAWQALNDFSRQRAYPNEIAPQQGYRPAINQLEAMSNMRLQSVDEGWESIGPKNIAGRILAMAFNPNNPDEIWVGSASGGLWKTVTAGLGADAWTRIPTGHNVLSVSAITFNPNDPDEVYIGTGEVYGYQDIHRGVARRPTRGFYGIGVLKTTNGGTTWSKSLDWSKNEQRGIQMVRVNPQNPSTVWAATTEGTYVSYDAGGSWTNKHDVIMATDIKINPDDTTKMFVAVGNLGTEGHGLYRSVDGGNSFDKLDQNGLVPAYGGKMLLDLFDADPNVIYASIGDGYTSANPSWIYRTLDGGDNWTQVTDTNHAVYQGWFAHFVDIHPTNYDNFVAGGVQFWTSTNAGEDMTQRTGANFPDITPGNGESAFLQYMHPDMHAVLRHPTDENTFFVGGDGGVFRSIDGGVNWQSVNGGLQTVQFYNGTSTSWQTPNYAVGGLQDNGTIVYDGDANQWDWLLGGDGSWSAIDPRNDKVVYTSWQYLNIIRFAENDQNGTYLSLPRKETTGFIAPFVLSPANPDVIYGGSSFILRSDSMGLEYPDGDLRATWTITNGNRSLNHDPVLALAASWQSEQVVYATTAPVESHAGVFVTRSGGNSWKDITGILPDRYPSDIAVNPQDDANAYVVFNGFGTGHVFKTTDYGNAWTDITADLPDVPTSAVIVDPQDADHIYIGNDLGVFVSTDAGSSWERFSVGMPEAAIVMDLTISPADRMLRAATHGNGMYQCQLAGDLNPMPVIATTKVTKNYPNPFSSSTTIEFEIDRVQFVTLKVYDVRGREVATLVNQNMTLGIHEVRLDASNLANGIYFYRLKSDYLNESGRLVKVE